MEFALFESHVRYAIVAWGASSISNTEKVLRLQKRAIRCLGELQYKDSCRATFSQLKILTVINLYVKEVILYVLTTNYPKLGDWHKYNTRNGSKYKLESHRLNMFSNKPSYKGAKFYNLLPENLKKSDMTMKKFKSELTIWLQNNPFYTIKEFIDWKNL